ncbi:O-antigen ligase family protein [Gordonia sp. CPCC 205515]|uniref:O-antigen ligase family protein n=1 Tax=Gordonia sp. CPCC 205515 TaxID=3140791 RepID=UPI003AF35626
MSAAGPAVAAASGDTTSGADESRREPTPWLLMCLCFVLPAVPSYVVLAGPLKSNGALPRMISMIMFGLVVLGFLVYRRAPTHRPSLNPGALILLAYWFLWLLLYGVGLLSGGDYTVATSRTRAMITLTSYVGVGLYVIARVRTQRVRMIVLGSLAAGLSFACLVGFLQGVSTVDLRYLFQPPGFVLNTDDLTLSQRDGATRVRGTSSHPIEFSVLAASCIPLTIYLSRYSTRRSARILAVGGCILALLALPASVSRTGIIAVIAAMMVYMLAFRVRVILPAILIAATAIGAYTASFPHITTALWQTITGSAEDNSIKGRTADYAAVGDLLREHPLFGLGLGGSPPEAIGFLDNEWMQAIVQGGLMGLAAMSLVMCGAFFGISASLRRATSQQEREQAYMLGGIVVGIAASSFTFDLFAFAQASTLLFVVFGLLWAPFRCQLDLRSQVA